MIQTAIHQHISFGPESKLSLDIGSNRITISETNGGDQITISGISDDAIKREISYYARLKRWSHDEKSRIEAMEFLTCLINICTESLKELNKSETTA